MTLKVPTWVRPAGLGAVLRAAVGRQLRRLDGTLIGAHLLFLTALCGVFGLSVLWEFLLADLVYRLFDAQAHASNSPAHRWVSVYMTTGFAAIALVGPGLILLRLIRRLKHSESEIRGLNAGLRDQIESRTRDLCDELAERRRAEERLRSSEARFKQFAESAADWFWEMDAELRFSYLAGNLEQVMGIGAADIIGKTRRELFEGRIDDPEKWHRHFADLEQRRPFADFEFLWRCPDKTVKVLRISGRPFFDPYGRFLGYRGTGRDITEPTRLLRQLSHQASHDQLTGLFNRRAFERRVQQLVAGHGGQGGQHALCYLDLDQFKVVNDTCGHAAGDELLRQVTGLLTGCVRRQDMLARIGSDEFGLLMEACSLAQAERVTANIQRLIGGFRFNWDDHSFRIGISIGLVPINGDGGTETELLSAADAACFAAKELGRNRVHVYRKGEGLLARRQGEMHWLARIEAALEGNLFRLRAQPIVPTRQRDSTPAGFEVLVEMDDGQGGALAPSAFLPAAERYSMASRIDRWVIREVFRYLGEAPDLDQVGFYSINLSGQTLADEEVTAYLIGLVESAIVPVDKICFEITESAVISNLANAVGLIKRLRRRGCRFALDDFGSGLSSFAYLKTLPVDVLKIDGQFVKDMTEDPVDCTMVEAIAGIAQVMGLYTVAESVENEATLRLLQQIGIDYAQGYAVGRPRPLAAGAGR